MNTIREQLDAEIATMQSEVDRLSHVVRVEYPAAQARLQALTKLSGDLTRDFEDFAARLKDAAFTVPVNDPAPKEATVDQDVVTRSVQLSTTAPALSVPRSTPKKGKKR